MTPLFLNPIPIPSSAVKLSGEAKGLKQTLEERGFDVSKLKAKCSPVCPFESTNCCMARLLSQQDDFVNQESMLESFIKEKGHLCLFLPKFHCELNPIEMVKSIIIVWKSTILTVSYVVLGLVQIPLPRTYQKQFYRG